MSQTATPRLWALVPVKPFALSKRRLMSLLSAAERARLARAMLQDVLAAMMDAPSLAGVTVVTADADAAALAVAAGVGVVADDSNAGMTAALTQALRRLPVEAQDGVLILPADVPAIGAADIEAIAAAHRGAPSVTLTAASDGGTNALACSPLDAIALQFGSDSFRRHCDAARAAGIVPQVLPFPGVALDIDRPADILALIQRRTNTRSHAYLITLGIAKRRGQLRCLA